MIDDLDSTDTAAARRDRMLARPADANPRSTIASTGGTAVLHTANTVGAAAAPGTATSLRQGHLSTGPHDADPHRCRGRLRADSTGRVIIKRNDGTTSGAPLLDSEGEAALRSAMIGCTFVHLNLGLRTGGTVPFSNDDESDYGSEDDIKEPTNYSTNEGIRRNRAIAAEKAGRLYGKVLEEPDPQRARNILRWIHHGDRSTMEFLKHIMTRLGSDPTLPRTVGEVTLLQHQNQAVARYNSIVHGDRAPIVIASIGTPEAITQLANALAPQPEQPATTKPAPTQNADAQDADADMPDAPGVTPPVLRAYLGSSPTPDDGASSVILTENDDAERDTHRPVSAPRAKMVRWYGNIPTSHWPKGMRISISALPDMPTTSPWVPDVTSWCTLNALSPVRVRRGSSLHRARFLDAATRMLSVHGTYLRYAEEGNYVFDNLPLEHYPFDATNISFAQITAWLIQHGIALDSEDLATLESYARSRRNHIAGNEDLNAHEFDAGHPATRIDVDNIIIRDEDRWDRLRHATTRTDVSTNYPQFPAGVNGGLAASMHAPGEPGGSGRTDA
ncbi:hypothetical protein DFH09DRAFT_1341365 [Mycena vulgaris]|nr:hypothetical protein DFH09DRAFT_1341365 [Mycena vulgaris]